MDGEACDSWWVELLQLEIKENITDQLHLLRGSELM